MPADPSTDSNLTSFFAALGALADRTSPGTAEGARRRGERRRHRLIASYAAVAVLVAGVAGGAAWLAPRPAPPPADPQPTPTGTFIPLRSVAPLPMEIAGPDPDDGSLPASVTVLDGVAYVHAGGNDAPLRVGALNLATGSPVFPTVDLGLWDQGPVIAMDRDGLYVQGDPRDARSEERMMMLDPATGAVRWEKTFDPFYGAIPADGVILLCVSPSTVVGLDWRTGEELWRRPYPGRTVTISGGYTSAPSLPSRATAGDLRGHLDTRVVIAVGESIDVIDGRSGQSHGTVTLVDDHRFAGLNDDTVFAGAGREVWAYPMTGGAPTLAYTAPEGMEAMAMPCGAGLLCAVAFSDTDVSTVVLDRSTYQELFASYGTAVGDRFLTPDGHLLDLTGQVVGPTGNDDEMVSWWVSTADVLTIDLSETTDEYTATVSGVSAQDGRRVELGQFPAGPQPIPWIHACGIDTHYLVCPAGDGFHAWQFAAD
jgi:outer membrane protein assembly factor BamB